MEFLFGTDTQSLHYTCLTHRKRQCVAVASCMYLCREVKNSNWKQMCLLLAEVSSDEIILSDASSTQCMPHSRWKSGNIVDYFGVNNVRKLQRDQFEVGVSSVVFSSLMDLKDALGQLAAFSVRHLVLLFVPFLSLALVGICTFFFFFLVHIQHKAVLHKQRGSWFNLKVVDDEHSNFLFCFRTRRDGFSGFHPIFLFLFLATVI